MIVRKILKNIKSIFTLGESVFIKEKDKIIFKSKEFNLIDSVIYYDSKYIIKISDGIVEFYDVKMNLLNHYENHEIGKYNSSFIVLDENNFFWDFHNSETGKNSLKYIHGIDIKIISNSFYGKILNQNYRLNFPDGTFSNPTKFTCSDLLGTTDNWKYQCEEGFQAKNNWIVRGDYLLFCVNKQGYFVGKFIKINIKTGVIKWQVDVNYTDMIYNELQGLFVSFWAGNNNGKNYQIIDIDNETIDIGTPNTDTELANVNSFGQLQFLEGCQLFFADNVHSYGNITVPVKFGCFDIKSKSVIFLQEIPIEFGVQISQMIYNEDKLYIRMTENSLLVYEDA